MNWKKAIGYGVAIYAILFVIISALLNVITSDYFGLVLVLILAVGAAYVYKTGSAKAGFQVGIVWAVVALVLDLLISRQFVPDIMSSWTVWIGYAILILAPTLITGQAQKTEAKEEAK